MTRASPTYINRVVHLIYQGMSNGLRCNEAGETKKTDDLDEVTCAKCLRLHSTGTTQL